MNALLDSDIIFTEQQLSEMAELLFLIPGGVSIATDPSCKQILHNQTASEFLRIRPGDNFSLSADNPPLVESYDEHGVELPAEELSMQKAIAEGKENKQIIELVWPDRVRRIAVWNSKPIFRQDGKIIGSISISEDITSYVLEGRQIHNEQEQLRIEIERLDRLKHVSHLAAGISHEIRNPLTTVRGFLQIMRSRPNRAEDKETFDMLLEELDRANDIISDFLSLTKVQEKQLIRDNILRVIGRIAPLLENDAFIARKKLVLKKSPVADMLMDSKGVKQLILNLVRNALEATPTGGQVRLETFQTDQAVGFTVTDQGEGIPKDVIEKLGTPFMTTKAHGTGVGLAISYDIAHHHNAVIDVQTGSKGTTFRVESPKMTASSGQSV